MKNIKTDMHCRISAMRSSLNNILWENKKKVVDMKKSAKKEKKTRKKYKCLCCGYMTLETRGEFDICPVCFWEDDAYLFFDEQSNMYSGLYYEIDDIAEEKLLDIPSGANHGLTLQEGRKNYKKYGACEKSMKKHVRKPKKREYPDSKHSKK